MKRALSLMVVCSLALALASSACGDSASGDSDTLAAVDGGGGMDASSGNDLGSTPDTVLTRPDGLVTPDVPPAPIEVPLTCADYAPCGGSVTGEWVYTGVCMEQGEVFEAMLTACPEATIDEATGTVWGTLIMVGGLVNRKATVAFTATATAPGSCAFGQCAAMEAGLAPFFESASCAAAAALGCTCTIEGSYSLNDYGLYTIDGNTSSVYQRKFDFCVSGDTMMYDEVTGQPDEPGIYTLVRLQ